MPVTYKINSAKRLIRTTCTGKVNPEEVANHFRELERDPNRPDRLNVLLDLSEVTSLPETPDLRMVRHQLEKLTRSVQFQACAIVACDDALFGMMRMFEVFAREHFVVTHVFRLMAEAEAWLESNESTFVA
jgi:hypothetical protein